MPKEFEQTYIGDGVYAQWDGMTVLLETERDNGRHYIYLDPQHVENIVRLMKEEPRFAKERRMAEAAQIGWKDLHNDLIAPSSTSISKESK